MNDEQLLRYSRHLLLPEIDVAGQERLQGSTVLIVGLGGLGCPCAMYLAASGVGRLLLCDPDTVELSNLQRQVAFADADQGRTKAEALAGRLATLNSGVHCEALCVAADVGSLPELVARADLVVDGSDNFTTRFAVNAACVVAGRPLVSGAAIRWEGQVAVFDPRRDESPCYACLYAEEGEDALNCNESGIAAPLAGAIGCLQALEVIKLLCAAGDDLCGRLLVMDGLHMDLRVMRLSRDPACRVCGT